MPYHNNLLYDWNFFYFCKCIPPPIIRQRHIRYCFLRYCIKVFRDIPGPYGPMRGTWVSTWSLVSSETQRVRIIPCPLSDPRSGCSHMVPATGIEHYSWETTRSQPGPTLSGPKLSDWTFAVTWEEEGKTYRRPRGG